MTRQVRKPRNIMPRLSGELWSRLPDTCTVPPGWDIFVTHSNKGYARSDSQTCTVPVWAYECGDDHNTHKLNPTRDPEYVLYYIAHELAHAWSYVNGGKVNLHDDAFYVWFKLLCPAHLWHHELKYKTRDARLSGIDAIPAKNINAANAPRPIRIAVDRMVDNTPAYESFTIEDMKRDAIKRDSRLKTRLAGLRDDEAKSFIRGWFQLD